jgi:hypothetical protein
MIYTLDLFSQFKRRGQKPEAGKKLANEVQNNNNVFKPWYLVQKSITIPVLISENRSSTHITSNEI